MGKPRRSIGLLIVGLTMVTIGTSLMLYEIFTRAGVTRTPINVSRQQDISDRAAARWSAGAERRRPGRVEGAHCCCSRLAAARVQPLLLDLLGQLAGAAERQRGRTKRQRRRERHHHKGTETLHLVAQGANLPTAQFTCRGPLQCAEPPAGCIIQNGERPVADRIWPGYEATGGGYWGVTHWASLGFNNVPDPWCEADYEMTPFIAEFWNTLTSCTIIIWGVYGM